MGWILRAWQGQERLWKVFWIYGVILGIILQVIGSVVAALYGVALQIPALIFYIIYTIWLLVAEWRCAFNAEWKIWGYVVRILIIFGQIIIIIGVLAGGVLIGSDLIKHAECRKETKEYVAQGGTDAESFKARCIESKSHSNDGFAIGVGQPQVNVTVIPPGSEKYKISCEKTMTTFSQKNGYNAQQYIAQNQAYLLKCIQHYQSKDAVNNKK